MSHAYTTVHARPRAVRPSSSLVSRIDKIDDGDDDPRLDGEQLDRDISLEVRSAQAEETGAGMTDTTIQIENKLRAACAALDALRLALSAEAALRGLPRDAFDDPIRVAQSVLRQRPVESVTDSMHRVEAVMRRVAIERDPWVTIAEELLGDLASANTTASGRQS